MLIREATTVASASKEVKVRVPVRHHLRLHTMKVLTGAQISDIVSQALDAYFASQTCRDALGRHAVGAGSEEADATAG